MKPYIDSTQFGSITIEGMEYSHDIVVRLNGDIKKRKKKLSKAVFGTSHIVSRDEAKHILDHGAKLLIVGTGPAGLCLAAQLAQFPEIDSMIVELSPCNIEKGKADGVNTRTMEMFQAFGFAEKIKRESIWINETTFWAPDPDKPANIRKLGSVQDVADGLSEMPHVLINQPRVHDMFLDIMRNSPSRLEPDYNIRVLDLKVDPEANDYPVTVTLERTDAEREGQLETIRARYVVGCDGARSNVRHSHQ